MNNSQSIINFMYFANNFNSDAIENCFEVCNNPSHLKSKYNGLMSECKNGTEMFFRWFMLLSRDNQVAVTNWININYDGCGFKKRKEEAMKTFEETTDYIMPIIGQLTTQLEKSCIAFKTVGFSHETPRYLNFGDFNEETKVLTIKSTNSKIWFEVQTDFNYIDVDLFWSQFKKFRTDYLVNNHPTINPY